MEFVSKQTYRMLLPKNKEKRERHTEQHPSHLGVLEKDYRYGEENKSFGPGIMRPPNWSTEKIELRSNGE